MYIYISVYPLTMNMEEVYFLNLCYLWNGFEAPRPKNCVFTVISVSTTKFTNFD